MDFPQILLLFDSIQIRSNFINFQLVVRVIREAKFFAT